MAKKNEIKEQPVQQEVVQVVIPEKPVRGILFSRLDHQESYVYDGQTCMITPKGKINVEDVAKLAQPLAKGLILRKID